MEEARGDAGLSDNLEVVKRIHAAFDAGDDDGQRSLMHPDVELFEWPESPDSHRVRGIEETQRIRNSWYEAWESLDFVVDEFLDAGDRVVSCGRAHAMGKGSTVPVDFESYTVFTLRDGKVARMEFFIEKEQALAAAGLTRTQEAL